MSVNAGITLTYSGVIAGSSTLTKAGTGALVLSGVNTYTGLTTLTAGTMSVAADSALGAAPGAAVANQLTFNGGILQATASFSLDTNRGITLTAAGTVNVDPSVTLSYGGVIAGASTLTKSGTGTLVLSGTNTYSGATTVSVGVLRVQNAAALGTTAGGTTVTSGAAIEIDGSALAIAENITSLNGTGVERRRPAQPGQRQHLVGRHHAAGAGARINSDAGTLTLAGGVTGNTRALTDRRRRRQHDDQRRHRHDHRRPHQGRRGHLDAVGRRDVHGRDNSQCRHAASSASPTRSDRAAR